MWRRLGRRLLSRLRGQPTSEPGWWRKDGMSLAQYYAERTE